MATRRLTPGQVIEMLQIENDELKTRVYELNEKITRMEARGRRTSEMRDAAWGISRTHLRAKKRLEGAAIWIYIRWLLIGVCSVVLLFSVVSKYVLPYESKFPIFAWFKVKYIIILGHSEVISAASGSLGIIISIIGQLTFPAPNRTFFAILAFSVKQIADILLGEPYALFLILFAMLIMYFMDFDRKKHVSTVRRTQLCGFFTSCVRFVRRS